MEGSQKNAVPWHAHGPEFALAELHAQPTGLSESAAQERLQRYGRNLLPEKGPTPLWLIIVRQFISPLIYILIAAAVVSLALGDFKDAGFIAAVLAINAAIGAYQEAQAEKSSFALRKLLRMHAQVEREGEVREIEAEAIVPGDIVWLESGNRVPADMRLLSTHGVEIDESLLTGESLAVSKDSTWIGAESATLGDRKNMAFAGSIITRGRAKGVVAATGLSTHVGQLALDVMGGGGGTPPLLQRMERFTNQVAIGTILASLLVGGISIGLGNTDLKDAFFLVVALAVSAIPEGLPVAMTVALAVATSRMAKRNVIVRRLTAVEGLGSCTLIATDKTGTLTCNELTIRELQTTSGETYEVTGEGFAPLGNVLRQGAAVSAATEPRLAEALAAAVLCNEADLHQRNGAWAWHGDAVDVAILSLGRKAGVQRETLLDAQPQVNQIPFESEHQFAATFHQTSGQTVVYVKGAPERVLDMCQAQLAPGQRAQLEETALGMARRGLRVIALATGAAPSLSAADVPPRPENLRLLGFLGMIDPLRPGARDAVAQCHSAGVEVTMITGDHKVTALAIARDLGLAESEAQVLTAAELEGKTPEELAEITRRVRVFARVTPRQKLEIVSAARKAGHFVAVTGDGVNDAPALRAANIGVAMGKAGTDVAREAAELVISDDDFRSIVAGIEEGRIAYDNIRKVIYLLVSMGAAELLMVLLSVITGQPIPLLPVQLLWLNLVTNGIQGVALAFEPGEGDSLRRKPRPPNEPIFNRLLLEQTSVAVLVVGVGGFLVFSLARYWGLEDPAARNLLLLTMVLYENFHIGNCRSETKPSWALSPLRSPMLLCGALGAFFVHLLGMHLPFMQTVLYTQSVSLELWLVALGASVLIAPALDLHKWCWKQRFPAPA